MLMVTRELGLPVVIVITITISSDVIGAKTVIFWSNRPRSIYQYCNMAPRLSGQTSIFGVVFFVSKSLLGIGGQKKLEKFAILTRTLIYRKWPILIYLDANSFVLLPKPRIQDKILTQQNWPMERMHMMSWQPY